LERLLDAKSDVAVPGKAELTEELGRAELVAPQDLPPTVVTMNSTVRFRVESSPEEFGLMPVYPKDVDDSGSRLSIPATVGSALMGLSQGDGIAWPKPGGGELRVRIVEVVYQPERSGIFHH
jgi:regulator of nucleoside diphosphate kinase